MTILRSRPARHVAPTGYAPAAPKHEFLEKIEPDQHAEFRSWRPSRRLKALLLANFGMASFYLTWWLAPGHVGTPILFYLLAAAEAFNLMHLVGLWWAIWATKVDPPPKHRTAFSIDVFIPTYGEPLHVLARTIKAAVDMDVAHTTYVCDDANNPEVKALAEKLGARYFKRRSNRGFKAGNLNHALVLTEGELFAMFDADHVPRKDFLRRIVGYFEDPTVGFVQTPQYYGNSSDNAVARGAYQQQAIFYGPIMRGKNGMAAAFCCGTNAVFRRTALEEVGGFDEKSVVEDFVTSMRIHRRGWRSVYYPYVLADGLGPANLKSYFKQQFRWARGSVGALFSLEPFKPGLTIGQRVQYFLATTFYLIGLVTAIYVALPIVYLLTGLSAFSVGSGTFILFYAPYVLLALATIRWGLGGQLRLEHVRYTYGTFPVYGLAAVAALLHIPARFKVTRKDAEDRPRPPVLALVTVLAFAATVVAMMLGVFLRPLHARTITNLSWGFINLLLLAGIGGVAARELLARRRPEMVRMWETTRLARSLRPIAGGAPGVALEEALPRPRGGISLTQGRRLVLPEYAVPPDMPAAPKSGIKHAAVQVAGLTVLGLMLRLALVNVQSLRLDESVSLHQVQQYSLIGLWHYLITANVHVPLYHTILHFWVQWFGTSEWVLRIPSVLFGAASVPLVYVVGKRIIGPRAAVFATALGATSPFWVWHSDEARMYPLLLFMALASLALLFRAVEQGGRWRWVAYAVVTGLSLYSHYFAILMLPVHLAYLVINRVSWRKLLAWGGAMAGVAAIFAPWLIALYFLRIHGNGGGVASLANGVRTDGAAGVTSAVYGSLFFMMVYLIGYAVSLGHGVGILAMVSRVATGGWPVMAFLGATRRKPRRLRSFRSAAFLTAWLVLTMGVVFVLNIFKPGLWLERYLIVASPAVFLVVAAGLSRVVRLRMLVVVLAFVTLGSASVFDTFTTSNPVREDFRNAASVVMHESRPGDYVLVMPFFDKTPLDYYIKGQRTVLAYQLSGSAITRTVLPKLAARAPGASVWAVSDTFYRTAGRTDVPISVPRYLSQNFVQTGSCSLGRLHLSRYEIPTRSVVPTHEATPWASCLVQGRNLATMGAQVTISRSLAWFLAIVNLLCILVAGGAFWYSRRSRERRGLRLSRRRRTSRGGLESEVEVPVDNGPVRVDMRPSLQPPRPRRAADPAGTREHVVVPPDPVEASLRVPAKPDVGTTRPANGGARPAAPSGDGRDEIVRKLSDPDPFLRISAITALKGRPDTDRFLVRALSDEYPLVRREAVRALREVGSSQATEVLIQVAGHDPSAEVREEAVAALGALVRERHSGRL